jgi:glycine betaine/choline ABC-type transport system substrate-binding protein
MDRAKIFGGVVLLALSVGCQRGPKPVVVGSKNFTEQWVLGEIVAQHLEHRLKEKVDRKLNLGGTLLVHQAMLIGDVDVYPEYTGTAYTGVLKASKSTDAGIVRERVKDEYNNKFQWSWMKPLGFDNSFALVVRAEEAGANGLKTLSDAVGYKEGWRMGAGYEFQQRPDGLPALMSAYELPLKATPMSMDLGLLYQALREKKVNMVAGNMTDGLLTSTDLVVLRDDKAAFPPYEAALVVRNAALTARPALRAALEELSGRFSTEAMRKLNYQVDVRRRQVSDIAREFLRDQGLVQ